MHYRHVLRDELFELTYQSTRTLNHPQGPHRVRFTKYQPSIILITELFCLRARKSIRRHLKCPACWRDFSFIHSNLDSVNLWCVDY